MWFSGEEWDKEKIWDFPNNVSKAEWNKLVKTMQMLTT